MRTLHLVVGYDYSELSQLSLAHAQAVARGSTGAEITVVEVLSPPALDSNELMAFSNDAVLIETHRVELENALKAWPVPAQARLIADVRFGNPADEVCEVAKEVDADFIFVGTHARAGIGHFFASSIAERTVLKAPCSVIVVRARESDRVPKVEPLCPDCQELKRQAQDSSLWCHNHTHHGHLPLHLHYKYPEHFARGTMNLRFDE
jgi:nucleotide-binding universal stress UspA family protein